jgi:hypothetical protein
MNRRGEDCEIIDLDEWFAIQVTTVSILNRTTVVERCLFHACKQVKLKGKIDGTLQVFGTVTLRGKQRAWSVPSREALLPLTDEERRSIGVTK